MNHSEHGSSSNTEEVSDGLVSVAARVHSANNSDLFFGQLSSGFFASLPIRLWESPLFESVDGVVGGSTEKQVRRPDAQGVVAAVTDEEFVAVGVSSVVTDGTVKAGENGSVREFHLACDLDDTVTRASSARPFPAGVGILNVAEGELLQDSSEDDFGVLAFGFGAGAGFSVVAPCDVRDWTPFQLQSPLAGGTSRDGKCELLADGLHLAVLLSIRNASVETANEFTQVVDAGRVQMADDGQEAEPRQPKQLVEIAHHAQIFCREVCMGRSVECRGEGFNIPLRHVVEPLVVSERNITADEGFGFRIEHPGEFCAKVDGRGGELQGKSWDRRNHAKGGGGSGSSGCGLLLGHGWLQSKGRERKREWTTVVVGCPQQTCRRTTIGNDDYNFKE